MIFQSINVFYYYIDPFIFQTLTLESMTLEFTLGPNIVFSKLCFFSKVMTPKDLKMLKMILHGPMTQWFH
jgi:hypothetical protein